LNGNELLHLQELLLYLIEYMVESSAEYIVAVYKNTMYILYNVVEFS